MWYNLYQNLRSLIPSRDIKSPASKITVWEVFWRLSKERELEMSMRHLARYLEINFCSWPFCIDSVSSLRTGSERGREKIGSHDHPLVTRLLLACPAHPRHTCLARTKPNLEVVRRLLDFLHKRPLFFWG